MPAAHAGEVKDSEFIRAAPDNWSFEGAETHARFIPFGSNLVLSSKEDLNLFGPQYSPERFEKILAACASLRINLLKVFLPIGQVLPDPQAPGEVHVAPGYFDHLADFLTRCRKHDIRAVVALTEWGGNGCAWWQEGGQYFGRQPWKNDGGIDSLGVLRGFWKELATRFKDEPALFSYTPAVEWTFPATNLTWQPPHGHQATLSSEAALWYWRAWVKAKYKAIEPVNQAWGTAYASFDEVDLPDYGYDAAAKRYRGSESKIFDYQNFREWASLRYMKTQLAAIRAADPNHMTTISNHMRFWDLWEGVAEHFLGVTPAEQKPYVDYVTYHANFAEDDPAPGRTDADIAHFVQVMARFTGAGKPMPIILEEFTYVARDPERVAEVQRRIVEETIGHVSGWTTWYLMFPLDPAEGADSIAPGAQSGWLTPDLQPTRWGETARALFDKLRGMDLARRPAKSVVALERRIELVPKGPGQVTRHCREYDPEAQPIDYQIAHEPDLDIVLPGEPPSGQ